METRSFKLLVIGGSAGSLVMVLKILPLLKKGTNLSVIIIFHRKNSEETELIELIASRTALEVKEPEDKEDIRPGVIYIAPADYHVLVENDHTLSLDSSEKINYCRPSIDVTFESASEVFKESLACMLLSGANADGASGLVVARKRGAYIIVQDPAEAEVPYMPQQALAHVEVDLLLSDRRLNELKQLL